VLMHYVEIVDRNKRFRRLPIILLRYKIKASVSQVSCLALFLYILNWRYIIESNTHIPNNNKKKFSPFCSKKNDQFPHLKKFISNNNNKIDWVCNGLFLFFLIVGCFFLGQYASNNYVTFPEYCMYSVLCYIRGKEE
jgi:hypothetical protein